MAAGVGLNLQVASNVVLAELSWTAAEQTQAIDRSHRIGQTEPVTAWRIIAAQTIDARIAEQEAERSRMRKTQVGTGDRSAKIRTYNFPQDRVTDHRINLTLHDLQRILDGDLGRIIEALQEAADEENLGEG